jgi:TonB family protein
MESGSCLAAADRTEYFMNLTVVCVAAALICVGTTAASAESSVALTANVVSVASNVSASIAGLNAASVQSLPGFPVKAYRDGHRSGRVLLGYTVNADGSVSDVQLIDAYPMQVFTRTASKTVERWRFEPTGSSERRMVEFQFTAD